MTKKRSFLVDVSVRGTATILVVGVTTKAEAARVARGFVDIEHDYSEWLCDDFGVSGIRRVGEEHDTPPPKPDYL